MSQDMKEFLAQIRSEIPKFLKEYFLNDVFFNWLNLIFSENWNGFDMGYGSCVAINRQCRVKNVQDYSYELYHLYEILQDYSRKNNIETFKMYIPAYHYTITGFIVKYDDTFFEISRENSKYFHIFSEGYGIRKIILNSNNHYFKFNGKNYIEIEDVKSFYKTV